MTSNQSRNSASMSVLLPLFSNPFPEKIPYWEAEAGDTLIAHLFLAGSLDPEESWHDGILFHSMYFMFHVSVTEALKSLVWEPQDDVRISVRTRDSLLAIARFPEFTGAPEQCADRMKQWLRTVSAYLAK